MLSANTTGTPNNRRALIETQNANETPLTRGAAPERMQLSRNRLQMRLLLCHHISGSCGWNHDVFCYLMSVHYFHERLEGISSNLDPHLDPEVRNRWSKVKVKVTLQETIFGLKKSYIIHDKVSHKCPIFRTMKPWHFVSKGLTSL